MSGRDPIKLLVVADYSGEISEDFLPLSCEIHAANI
jgi:hypothetical protein